MKFNIPTIVKSVDLGEYDQAYKGQEIWMWVNPPKRMRREFDQINKDIRDAVKSLLEELTDEEKQQIKEEVEKLQAQQAAWWAEMWSQHEDEETHWSVEDVQILLEESADKDPQLWNFLTETSLERLKEHIIGNRKK